MVFFLLSVALTAACERIGSIADRLADVPSPAEITRRVTGLAADGNVVEAIRIGEEYLAKTSGSEGDLHRKLAELYVVRGDAMQAASHLQKSIERAPAAPRPSGELAPNQQARPSSPIGATDSPVTSTSASVESGRVEARAGGTSVKISD